VRTEYLPILGIEIIEMDRTDDDEEDRGVLARLMEVLMDGGDVDSVHEDSLVHFAQAGKVKPALARNDPSFGDQWPLLGTSKYGLDMAEAWGLFRPESQDEFVIGVIDSGVDLSHPDIMKNLWRNRGEIPNNGRDDDGNGYIDDVYGYDFFDDDGDPSDEAGHGTHISGIIAAEANNTRGISGVCPQCKVMPLKFMDDTGYGYWGNAIKALEYALQNRVKVTCNAYGTYTPHKALEQAIKKAGQKGMLFVAAAGNDGKDNDRTPKLPASYTLGNVISVASIGQTGKLSWFSNYGKQRTDIAAPGEDIYSLDMGRRYKTDSGTSMAAPFVAGVAAMVWLTDPKQTYSQVKLRIMRSARRIDGLKVKAEGTLDAAGALMQSVDTSDTSRCDYNDPCHINARCTDTSSGPICRCEDGFEGDGWKTCDDINECAVDRPCHENAKCINSPGSYKCQCQSGFTGDGVKKCEQFSLCSISQIFIPCHPLAICYGRGSLGIPFCECRDGFKGDGREECLDVNECLEYNGGCDHECVNTVGNFKCKCFEGYQLAPNKKACLDIDECRENNGGCEHICINEPGSYQCSCPEGYRLAEDGKSCEDIDECAVNNGGCSQVCKNKKGTYECLCDPGFLLQKDGRTCKDVECKSPPRIAHAASVCESARSGSQPKCAVKCERGFQLAYNDLKCDTKGRFTGGAECEDIDECKEENGGCNQRCVNKEGSFECGCFEGYLLDRQNRRTCQDINECMLENGGCEQECVNTEGSWECKCFKGYWLHDGACKDIDECAQGKCDQGCENSVGGFKCSCKEGYTLGEDGTSCVDVECGPPPKVAHAVKAVECYGRSATGPKCDMSCERGFMMRNNTLTCGTDGKWRGTAVCEDIDECVENIGGCDPTAECVNLPGSFECRCPDGFDTSRDGSCVDIDECTDSRYPENGGCSHTCNNRPGSYFCSCPPGEGFSLKSDKKRCTCKPGFTLVPARSRDEEDQCQDEDECKGWFSPCSRKATCTNTPGSYKCECKRGYTGDGTYCRRRERGLSVDNGRQSVRPPPRQLLAPLGIIPQRAASREEPQQPQPPAEESPTRQEGNGGFLSAAVAGYGQPPEDIDDRVDDDACCDVLSLSLSPDK